MRGVSAAVVAVASAQAVVGTAKIPADEVRGLLPATDLEYCNEQQSWGDIPAPAAVPHGVGLRQLHVTIRHGARTPAGFFSTSQCWAEDNVAFNCEHMHEVVAPDTSETLSTGVDGRASAGKANWLYQKVYDEGKQSFPGSCMTGQLIEEGFGQQADNGKKLRERYVDDLKFLPTDLQPAEVHLRSTEIQRTIQSGQALISGLWPAANAEPQWRVSQVPWHVRDRASETMVPNKEMCPAFGPAYDAVMAQASTEALKQMPEGVAAWKEVRGTAPSSLTEFGTLVDCVYEHVCKSRSASNQLLPTPLAGCAGQPLKQTLVAGRASIWEPFQNKNVAKLGFGLILRDYLAALEDVFSARSARKFYLWSGHDSGPIGPMLSAFDFNLPAQWQWPPFAAEMLWEVWTPEGSSDEGKSFFRFIYNGKVLLPKVCGQAAADIATSLNTEVEEWCPAHLFMAALRALIPTEQECQLKESSVVPKATSEMLV